MTADNHVIGWEFREGISPYIEPGNYGGLFRTDAEAKAAYEAFAKDFYADATIEVRWVPTKVKAYGGLLPGWHGDVYMNGEKDEETDVIVSPWTWAPTK